MLKSSLLPLLALLTVTGMLARARADVPLERGLMRIGIDVDVFSAGAVWTRAEGQSAHHINHVYAAGPNQLGNSRLTLPSTPVGLGADWVLGKQWLLGARVGVGYDRLKPEEGPSQNALALSLMPDVAFVMGRGDVRPFLKFSPIAQYTQLKQAGARSHMFNGCFSVGGGWFVFSGSRSSIDLGAYFEGRFGQLKGVGTSRRTDVDDLRGVLRLGVSLWR